MLIPHEDRQVRERYVGHHSSFENLEPINHASNSFQKSWLGKNTFRVLLNSGIKPIRELSYPRRRHGCVLIDMRVCSSDGIHQSRFGPHGQLHS